MLSWNSAPPLPPQVYELLLPKALRGISAPGDAPLDAPSPTEIQAALRELLEGLGPELRLALVRGVAGSSPASQPYGLVAGGEKAAAELLVDKTR